MSAQQKVYPGDRQGGPCGGWSTTRCLIPATERVVMEGCKHCGGECGDPPEGMWMCPACAAEARADGALLEDDG